MVEEAAESVTNEINCLSDLRHPSVMRLYEVIDEYSKVHLVMEICSGVPLNHVLKKAPENRLEIEIGIQILK
jgi:MAP/microtubule affinity-regulating kinase